MSWRPQLEVFMESEEKRFDEEVALAKANSVPYNVEGWRHAASLRRSRMLVKSITGQ